jgi:hypothetical protein
VAATLDKRIVKIFRLLGSSHDGEILAAVSKLKKICASEGLTLTDLVVSTGGGEASDLNEDEARAIYESGREAGRAELAPKDTEFFDADGEPQWYAIALHNREYIERLRNTWMRNFTIDIVDKVLGDDPTLKQAQWILRIFIKLGGTCSPEVRGRYFEQ